MATSSSDPSGSGESRADQDTRALPHGPGPGARILANDLHDASLLEQVHPPAWTNPAPASRYNLVVIGAGTAGLVTAAGAAGLGARVALIERNLMGGDCLNVGCVPSKALLRSAKLVGELRRAQELGFDGAAERRPDFARVMERMRRLRARLSPIDSAWRFRDQLDVDVFFGQARFSGPAEIDVAGAQLRFRRAVIATGGRPTHPPIPGLAEAGFLTNETVFTLTSLPARLAIVGGGPIGCELAQAFARLGSTVTLLEAAPRLLPRDDSEAAAIVHASLARDGITLALGASIERVAVSGAEKVVHAAVLGAARSIAVDEILVAAGRAPNLDGLDLEAAEVAYDPRVGVTVDDHLRTSNPRVFAAGDVCLAAKFTHTADFSARIAIQNALFHGRKRVSLLNVPWCTYTDPEVAHVGLSEDEARARGIATRVFRVALEDVDRAVLDGEEEGFVKILVRDGKDEILGATVVARHAGEMIAEIGVAMRARLGLGGIADVIHPYPTQADAIRKAGDQYNRTRLTPLVKRAFALYFRLRR